MDRDYHKPYFWYLVVTTIGVFLTHTGIAGSSFSALLSQVAMVVLAVFALRFRGLRASLSTLSGPVAFLFLATTLSLVLAQILHVGDKTLHKDFVGTVLLLSLLANREEWPKIRRTIARYGIFMVAFSFLLLLADGVVRIPHFWWSGRMIGVFSQPNTTAATLALALPFVLTADFLRDRSKIAVSLGICLLIGLTRSRTSTGIAMLAVGLFILKPWTIPWRPSRMLLVATFAGALVLVPFSENIVDFLSRGQDTRELTSLTGRTAIWTNTLVRIQGNVMTGVGSAAAEASVWMRDTKRYFETSGGAHNFYLAQALTYGVPHAAIVTLTLLGAVFGFLIRLRKSAWSSETFAERAWVAMALPGIVVFSVTEAGSSYPFYLTGQVFWLFLVQAMLSEKGLSPALQSADVLSAKHLTLVVDRTSESA